MTLKSREAPPPPTVLLTASHGTPTTIMGCKELHRLLTVSLGVRVFSGSLHRIAGKSFSSAVVRGGVRSAPPPSKPLASSNLKPRAATRSGESEAGTPGRRASAPTPVSRVVNIIDLAGVANKTLKGGAPQAVRRHAPPTGTGTGTQASGHEAATAGLSADSDTQCDPCDTLQGLYLAARHSVTVRGGAASTSGTEFCSEKLGRSSGEPPSIFCQHLLYIHPEMLAFCSEFARSGLASKSRTCCQPVVGSDDGRGTLRRRLTTRMLATT